MGSRSDESIRDASGDKKTMRPFVNIIWQLVSIIIIIITRTVSDWYVDVEVETFFALAFEEWSKSLYVVIPGWCLDGSVGAGGRRRRRRGLWTDGAVAQRHADPVPLLGGTGRRHEAEVTAEQRRVLESEVRLDERQAPVAEGDQHPAQLPVLGRHHPRAHLRRQHLSTDHRPALSDHNDDQRDDHRRTDIVGNGTDWTHPRRNSLQHIFTRTSSASIIRVHDAIRQRRWSSV